MDVFHSPNRYLFFLLISDSFQYRTMNVCNDDHMVPLLDISHGNFINRPQYSRGGRDWAAVPNLDIFFQKISLIGLHFSFFSTCYFWQWFLSHGGLIMDLILCVFITSMNTSRREVSGGWSSLESRIC